MICPKHNIEMILDHVVPNLFYCRRCLLEDRLNPLTAVAKTTHPENESCEAAQSWELAAYGRIVRGDCDTSEDQVAEACCGEMARRIVACVNDCQGIPTDKLGDSRSHQLNKETVKRLVSWLHDELKTATKQKSEYLENNDVQGYQFAAGYLKCLQEMAKII